MKKALAFTALLTLGSLSTTTCAQTIQGGWEIRVSNVVSPSQPTATVEVWAWFDNAPGVSEVFGGGTLDLAATEGDWPTNQWIFPLGIPDPGPSVIGSTIIGLNPVQLHVPSLGIFGNPSNPIHVFSADWATTNFTARTVAVLTENTTIFGTYSQAGVPTTFPASSVNPGSGTIIVVPSPAPLVFATIAFATFGIARQRRA